MTFFLGGGGLSSGEELQIVTMLGTHGHWAVRVLQRATPTVISIYDYGHLRKPVTLTPSQRLSEELSLPVFSA